MAEKMESVRQKDKQKKAKKPSRLSRGQKWLLAVAVFGGGLVAGGAETACLSSRNCPKRKGSQGRRHAGGGRHRLWRRRAAPRQRRAEESGLLHRADSGPGHRRRRKHRHHAAGKLRCDQPEGHVMSIPRDTMVKCQLGRQEDQLRLQHERRRGEGHQGSL